MVASLADVKPPKAPDIGVVESLNLASATWISAPRPLAASWIAANPLARLSSVMYVCSPLAFSSPPPATNPSTTARTSLID